MTGGLAKFDNYSLRPRTLSDSHSLEFKRLPQFKVVFSERKIDRSVPT